MYFDLPMKFEITEDHLTLLQNAYVYFDDSCYDGAPAIDLKRPYGNSWVAGDVWELLHGEYPEELDDDQEHECIQIHRETGTALQICLTLGKFETGVYERENYKPRSWRKIA